MQVLIHSHLAHEFPDTLAAFLERYPAVRCMVAPDRETIRQSLPETEVLITGNPCREELEIAARLRLLVIPFSGTAHISEHRQYLVERGIMVANSPGNGPIVAERAVALAMAVCGRIVEFHQDLARGNWHYTGDPHRPFDYWYSMLGRTAAILGTGEIGRGIARLLRGFGCRIIGYRRRQEVPPEFDALFTDLDGLIACADIIFIALPQSPETEGLIGAGRLAAMGGKVLINVARGTIVEEHALYRALEQGTLRGAGIDVWYRYPSKEHPIITGSAFPFHNLPNVVISPHAASHTPEGKRGMLIGALHALEGFLTSGVPKNRLF